MRCTVFLLYYIQKKRSVRKIKHGKNPSVPEQKKGGNIMRISKQTKKTTLAQQGRLSFDLPAEYAAAFSGWERAYSEPDAAAGI